MAKDKHKLNNKQLAFADEYITNGGNSTQAAITAGYSEKTAYSQGNRLLKHDEVKKYIKERTESLWNEKTMTVSEALALSAEIARGTPQEVYSKQFDHLKGEVIKEATYTVTPSFEDRQRSLDHIFKVNGAYLERKEISADVRTDKLDSIIDQLSDEDG